MSYTLVDLNVRQPTPAVTTPVLTSTTQPCQLQRQPGHLLKQAQHQPPLPASTINPDLAESTNPEQQAQAMPPKIASE